MEQGSAVEKKMQDIIPFYTQTSHGFHFIKYFPIGSTRRKARGFARLPSRRAISCACSWAREIARLEVGAPVRAPGRRRAGSRAFLLTPSAFPLDFWQRRYIFFGRVYVYCLPRTCLTLVLIIKDPILVSLKPKRGVKTVLGMYRVYCREATSHTAQEIGGVRPITSHASRPAPSVLYIRRRKQGTCAARSSKPKTLNFEETHTKPADIPRTLP